MRYERVFVVASVIVLMTAFVAYCAPARTVGVTVGDWASYSMMYEGNSTLVDKSVMENVTVATFTILGISGTNVTVEMRSHFLNGSEAVETDWIDVDTGESGENSTGMLIAADLSQGDLVYTTQVEPFKDGTINETINRDYLGSPVEVNHYVLNITAPPNPYYNASMSMDWYWYKATGIPAEISVEYSQETQGIMMWYSWHMTISSIVPEFPTVNAVLVFMIATLLIVAVDRRRARSPRWMHA